MEDPNETFSKRFRHDFFFGCVLIPYKRNNRKELTSLENNRNERKAFKKEKNKRIKFTFRLLFLFLYLFLVYVIYTIGGG